MINNAKGKVQCLLTEGGTEAMLKEVNRLQLDVINIQRLENPDSLYYSYLVYYRASLTEE